MKKFIKIKLYLKIIVILTVVASSMFVTSFANTYTYDNLNRLISVAYDNGVTIMYSYDAAGNIINIKKEIEYDRDVNDDGVVDDTDLFLVKQGYGSKDNDACDVNKDKVVDVLDLIEVMKHKQ